MILIKRNILDVVSTTLGSIVLFIFLFKAHTSFLPKDQEILHVLKCEGKLLYCPLYRFTSSFSVDIMNVNIMNMKEGKFCMINLKNNCLLGVGWAMTYTGQTLYN